MTDKPRLTLGDRIARQAPSIRPWQRSLASLVAEAFDDIECLPRIPEGYFSALAKAIDEHLEQEFRYDMAQSRAAATTRLARNPHDESAKALLAWVEEKEASPPSDPVKIGTLRETVFRERGKRKKAGTYSRVAHGVRNLFTGGHTSQPEPLASQEGVPPLANALLDGMPTTAIVTAAETGPRNSDHDTAAAPLAPLGDLTEARKLGATGDREALLWAETPTVDTREGSDDHAGLGASGNSVLDQPAHEASASSNHLAGGDARITNPPAPVEGVDAKYSQLNSGRGYDVERVGVSRPVRPRKLR